MCHICCAAYRLSACLPVAHPHPRSTQKAWEQMYFPITSWHNNTRPPLIVHWEFFCRQAAGGRVSILPQAFGEDNMLNIRKCCKLLNGVGAGNGFPIILLSHTDISILGRMRGPWQDNGEGTGFCGILKEDSNFPHQFYDTIWYHKIESTVTLSTFYYGCQQINQMQNTKQCTCSNLLIKSKEKHNSI